VSSRNVGPSASAVRLSYGASQQTASQSQEYDLGDVASCGKFEVIPSNQQECTSQIVLRMSCLRVARKIAVK
jgi:hypothetical protein